MHKALIDGKISNPNRRRRINYSRRDSSAKNLSTSNNEPYFRCQKKTAVRVP